MSNPKTAIQEIKNLMVKFGFMSNEEVKDEVKEEVVETIESNFAEAKLVDGTVVKVEGDLVEGAAVKVVTEDAEIPAPDGVHELEDGTKVETKDGVIVKVEKVEVEEPEVEIEVKKDVVEDEMYSLLKELMEKISDKMKKMEDKMSEIESDFNSFKKEPAAKKINSGKTDFGKVDNNDSLDSRINTILSMRQTNKK